MADGTFATLLILVGLTDMGANYCPNGGCLAPQDVPAYTELSAGTVLERRAKPEKEAYFRYQFADDYGPFGRAAGMSVGEHGETWIGAGYTYRITLGSTGLYAQLHLMPGLYFDNGGFSLGGLIAFRSGLEIGYENEDGWRYAISYDHRSNAGIYDKNPGVETAQFRVSAPWD